MSEWTVWMMLMLLLGLTVAVNHLALGVGGSLLALVIASLKALLVAVYYMHLRRASGWIRLTAGAALLWLGFLFFLSWADFLHR